MDNDTKPNFKTMLRVHFNTTPVVHVMWTWDFAYRQARKSKWEQVGRDRVRFHERVKHMESILLPVLDSNHRQKIYHERFFNNNFIKKNRALVVAADGKYEIRVQKYHDTTINEMVLAQTQPTPGIHKLFYHLIRKWRAKYPKKCHQCITDSEIAYLVKEIRKIN